MKYLVKFIVITFFLFAFTDLKAEIKIAYIDMDIILNESLVGKDSTKKLTEFHQVNLENFERISKELKKEENNLLAKRNIISKEEFNKQIGKLREKAKNFQLERKKRTKDFNLKYSEAKKKLLEIIKPILENYSEENNLSIVLEKKNIIVGSNNLNITKDILELLNKKIKSLELN